MTLGTAAILFAGFGMTALHAAEIETTSETEIQSTELKDGLKDGMKNGLAQRRTQEREKAGNEKRAQRRTQEREKAGNEKRAEEIKATSARSGAYFLSHAGESY